MHKSLLGWIYCAQIYISVRHEYWKSILEWNGILVKFWNGMEWNTENLEYYSSFWSILLNSIRVFRKSRYSENIQEYREKLYSSSIWVPKKVDIQKIFRNTEKNCTRVVLWSTEVFCGTKKERIKMYFSVMLMYW